MQKVVYFQAEKDFSESRKLLILLYILKVFKMDFKHKNPSTKHLIRLLLVSFALFLKPVYAVNSTNLPELEKQFQQVSSDLYSVLTKKSAECKQRALSLKDLNQQIRELNRQNKIITGNCLLQYNLPLLRENIDSKNIFPVFEYLLDSNNIYFANKLYKIAREDGDKSLVSNISFIYARYYLKRQKWNRVIQYVKGIYSDLATEDTNLAYLIHGLALQKIVQHRKAVKLYLKIPKHSKYYPAARLNIATAYIREDWWTDAHVKINEILEDKNITTDAEMINRLYLVLGYSLLRKEFYRDSREAFRNVELKSIYTNKALLGIALTATNQEDFVSALNAINILKGKDTYDLSVDEAHLLLPYLYEKLNQHLTATASYSDSINYYKNRIKNINTLSGKYFHNFTAEDILNNNNIINMEKNNINFSEFYPVSFLENNNILNKFSSFSSHISNEQLKLKYINIKTKYNNLLPILLSNILNKRIKHLTNYMNQSRFGLARLFDKSSTAEQ